MICWHFLHLPEVPLLLPGGRGVGSGGPEGPSRWPKATSPLQELEVGARRAPYLLVIEYYSLIILTIRAQHKNMVY